MLKKIVFIISLLFFAQTIYPQISAADNQLAARYFSDGEFIKASELYLELYKKSRAKFYFSQYISCLIELDEINQVEKLLKTEIRKNPKDLSLYVQQGQVYKFQNKNSKAIQSYERAIGKLIPEQNAVRLLANAFMTEAEYAWAEKVYMRSRDLMNDKTQYRYELGNLYYLQRKHKLMLDEYFSLINEKPTYLVNIQSRLQMALNNDIRNSLHDLIFSSLMSRIRNEPDNELYTEMLIWLRIQEKNFSDAIMLAIAVDKRLKTDGRKVFEVSGIAKLNKDYQAAIDGYQYLIDKGNTTGKKATDITVTDGNRTRLIRNNNKLAFPVYETSKVELLNVRYLWLDTKTSFSKTELIKLEKDIISTIALLGRTKNTSGLLQILSKIQGSYLGNQESAVNILENIDNIPGIDPLFRDECKLDLGDLFLSMGKIWDATLVYAGVVKRNPDNPTGSLAKYKKSKLAYYSGNFRWAQAQLDILKASTSKLIANDAMSLSLLISDNTGSDSTESAMKMFARADLLLLMEKDSLALLSLDSLLTEFKGHSLIDESLFKIAIIYENKNDFQTASQNYIKIYTKYPNGILADNAMFKHAMILETSLGKKEEAKNLYKTLITEYPGSIFVSEARTRFRNLRDTINPDETGS